MQELLKKTGEGADGWNTLWKEGLAVWNMGKPAPPLQEYLQRKETSADMEALLGQRVLVAGCGEGEDVMFLARFPSVRQAVGLDFSPLAVARCSELLAERRATAPSDSQDWPSKVTFQCQDFFTYQPSSQFNFCFDYTFFCAINPSLRQSWGAKYKEIVCEGGILFTIVFPIGNHTDGPPYAVSLKAYEDVLCPEFELIEGPYVSPVTIPTRVGREQIALWKRRPST